MRRVFRAPLGQTRGEEVSEIVRQNQKRIAKALAAELGEEVVIEPNPGVDKDDKKSLYEATLKASFEAAKPMLDEVLSDCKKLLSAGKPADEVRPLVLKMVQSAKVHHRCMKVDENYKVVRQNNGEAADEIMKCLLKGETVEQVLMCVYSQVYWLTYTDEEIAAIKAGNELPKWEVAESAETGESVDDNYLTQLADYLSYLANQFSRKVEEVEVEGEHILVPRPEFVRLRRARNGTWLLSWDSIFGEENNQWRGSEDDQYQAQFDVAVRDQELAAATSPDDLNGISQLIIESAPRLDQRKDQSGKPRNYIFMTREDNETLKSDIANLLGLPYNSSLLGWLRSELIKGASADELRALFEEKQQQWAERDAQPKENLLAKRPPRRPDVATVPDSPRQGKAERERTIRSLKAFIRSEIEGLSHDEALARKAEILEKAKAIL